MISQEVHDHGGRWREATTTMTKKQKTTRKELFMEVRSDRGALMRAEIAEQPVVLSRLLDEGSAPIRAVAEAVAARRPRFVVLAGRGTSDHAALYAKYLVETRLALPAGLASPSTLTQYGARPDLTDVLWVVVSQSGGSPDLVESTRIARGCGALTVAVTNAPGSALAAAAELAVDVLAGEERAVAATKSYTAQLLALHLLVDAVAGGNGAAARDLPDRVAEALGPDIRAGVDAAAQRYRFVERLVVTGRGYAYPTAREAALKLMETSYLSAHAFSAADLLHGPFAMIDQDRPVIAIAADGVGATALESVLDRLRTRDADVLLVAGRRVLDRWAGTRSTGQLALPDVAEEVAPVVQIVPMQLLALAMSVARGYDPDAPRGLAKLTLTS
jgi:glucosamine--fructose-6-phosphate aminotransferase (isomerizing)